ncbi:hypothetical protein W02_17200 [Nitrospira sp. KM1]|nr:hypothetical protein W02_17200 [Nitrospira sp. KM1]
MNILSVGCILVLTEVLLRLVAAPHPEGPLVGDTRLLPRNWSDVAGYRLALWKEHAAGSGVLVFDPQLGWTVAPNRSSTGPAGEKNFSSAEGRRIGSQRPHSLRNQSGVTIALMGNSYVFGSDVDYEQTWGFHLETQLAGKGQVWNFGVPAYGVDQAYLRYLKEVQGRRPDIAILGLISHDLIRTTMVYYAVGFPGAVVPGAKPRLVLRDGDPTPVNIPLPQPEAVYATARVDELPHVTDDRIYRRSDWQEHWYAWSYLLRYFVSWCNPCGGIAGTPSEDEETVALNGAILRAFVREAKNAGTIPIVVFLPSFTEYRDEGEHLSGKSLLGTRVLDRAKVEFVDMTYCVDRSDARNRFTSGWHYTPEANKNLAACLFDILKPHLSTLSPRYVN